MVIAPDLPITSVITSFLFIQFGLGLLAINEVTSDMGKRPSAHGAGGAGRDVRRVR